MNAGKPGTDARFSYELRQEWRDWLSVVPAHGTGAATRVLCSEVGVSSASTPPTGLAAALQPKPSVGQDQSGLQTERG